MRRVTIVSTGLIAALVVGLVAIWIAGHVGTSTGTSLDKTEQWLPDGKPCPGTAPNDCRSLVGETLNISLNAVPSIRSVPGLTYVRGEVVLPKDGSARLIAFHFASAEKRPYMLSISQRTAPLRDTRNAVRTPSGKQAREAGGSLGVIGLAYYDHGFQYFVTGNGEPGLLADRMHPDTASLRLAEQLLDAAS